MPYLDPELVIRQFASYLHSDVREAIRDERKYVHAQVGSMSSSLNFLARELDGMRVAINTQRRALEGALDDVEEALDDDDAAHDAVHNAVAAARERVDSAEGDPEDVEREVIGAANEVFASIRDELSGEEARRARRPLYEYLDTRVQTQLDLLGRE